MRYEKIVEMERLIKDWMYHDQKISRYREWQQYEDDRTENGVLEIERLERMISRETEDLRLIESQMESLAKEIAGKPKKNFFQKMFAKLFSI